MTHTLHFREWLSEAQAQIVPFHQAAMLQIPEDGVISFDFDGTLTRWNKNAGGWYQVPFIPVIRELKQWAAKGHKCIVCTHRTKELEGNPQFLGHGRDKMKVIDLIQDDVVPVEGSNILFTHMGDKGEILTGLAAKGLHVVMHYDDEMKNLTSVIRAGIIGVQVDPGPSPPKYVVAGDGQTPANQPAMAVAH